MKWWYLAISIFCYNSKCLSQIPSLYFHHLTVQQGLSSTPNLFIYKDSKGLVWISSVNGVNLFDGKNVKVYYPTPSKKNQVLGYNVQGGFYEDNESNIWFTTFDGINVYIRKNDHFKNYVLNSSDHLTTSSGYFSLGLDSNGRFWFLHRNESIFVLNTSTGAFTKIGELKEHARRGHILSAGQGGQMMAITYTLEKAGVEVHWIDSTYHRIQSKCFDFKQFNKKDLWVNDVVWDDYRNLWLSTNEGILSFDPVNNNPYYYPFVHGRITGIANIDSSKLAISTINNGLWFFDKLKKEYIGAIKHTPDIAHSIIADQLESIYADQDGNLWVSVYGRGIDFASLQKVKFNQLSIYARNISNKKSQLWGPMIEDIEGNIWCTTFNDGVYFLDQNLQLQVHYGSEEKPPYNLKYGKIYCIFQDSKQRIWLLSNSGLYCRSKNDARFNPIDQSEPFLYGKQLKDERLLFSKFNGGIWEFKDQNNSKHPLEPLQGVDESAVWTLFFEDSQNRLWGSHDLKKVSVFNRNRDHYSKIIELPISDDILILYEDPKQSIMWLAGTPGLYAISCETFEILTHTFTKTAIRSLVPLNDENLWLGTNRGLILFNLNLRTSKNYGLADGLGTLEFNKFSGLKKKDGNFLFGGGNNIISYNKELLPSRLPLATPHIARLTINDTVSSQLYCEETGVSSTSEMRKINLNYNENLLGFDLQALEYSDPEGCLIKYKMNGIDLDTVQVPSGTFVRYPNVAPGEYTLNIWAANSDGLWNPKAHQLFINIQAAFWQTWWFKFLILSSLVAILIFYFYQRDQQRIQVQNLRNNLSKDLHDELGSTLSSISIFSESASRIGGSQSNQFEQIGIRVREAMDNISDMVWAIKPQNDSMPSIIRRMKLFAAEILEPLNIKFEFKISEAVLSMKLISERRKDFYLIFKEAINNAAKYSHAKTIEITLEIKKRELQLSIKDNGIGFNYIDMAKSNENSRNGNGLFNMKARADTLKGKLSIQSSPNMGTIIDLAIPI